MPVPCVPPRLGQVRASPDARALLLSTCFCAASSRTAPVLLTALDARNRLARRPPATFHAQQPRARGRGTVTSATARELSFGSVRWSPHIWSLPPCHCAPPRPLPKSPQCDIPSRGLPPASRQALFCLRNVSFKGPRKTTSVVSLRARRCRPPSLPIGTPQSRE